MVLAITMGEPAGIATEITIKAWQHLRHSDKHFFVIGDIGEFERAGVKPCLINSPDEASQHFADALPLMALSCEVQDFGNVPNGKNAKAVLESIETSVELCKQGQVSAMITNPIHKAVLMEAGFEYSGHTDFLAHLCSLQKNEVVMMLANQYLRTVPITVHQPLSQVPIHLTAELIKQTAKITWLALKNDFGIEKPRLAVAGLNPHAGEAGKIGTEEQDFINEAITDLQKDMDIQGCFAADSLFTENMRGNYDVALCMYHDQALIPIKTLDFENAVNVSLGLPIIRTSPDHGSACDIKGKGMATPKSLIAAVSMAWEMAQNKHA